MTLILSTKEVEDILREYISAGGMVVDEVIMTYDDTAPYKIEVHYKDKCAIPIPRSGNGKFDR